MKESKVKIETQLKLLDIAEQEIENIIARNRISKTERHLNHIERKLVTMQDFGEVQEFMVSNEEQIENSEEQSNQLEERVLRYDVFVDKLKNELEVTMKKEEDQEKQKEEEKHEETCQRRMKEELEIEKKKLENQKKSNPMRGEIVREDRWKNVKLPKFLVVKFEGYTYRLVPLLKPA